MLFFDIYELLLSFSTYNWFLSNYLNSSIILLLNHVFTYYEYFLC